MSAWQLRAAVLVPDQEGFYFQLDGRMCRIRRAERGFIFDKQIIVHSASPFVDWAEPIEVGSLNALNEYLTSLSQMNNASIDGQPETPTPVTDGSNSSAVAV
jgi:hypothetical protein